MPGTNALECQMVKSARRQQTDLPLNEEQELIVQAGNGSPAAIELLVSRYESRIFRLARNITGNHEDAEEEQESTVRHRTIQPLPDGEKTIPPPDIL